MWLLVVLVVLLLLYLGSRKPLGFPPGPPRLPVLGYLPLLGSWDLLFKQLWRLSSWYGPVVGLYLGTQPGVVVNGWEAVKEALMNDDLNGRTESPIHSLQFGGRHGVAFTEGELWNDQRRFTLHQFRNLGFGKRSHETYVQEEAKALLQEIREAKGSVSLPEMLGVSSINILWAVLGGSRFDRKDGRLMDLVLMLNKFFRADQSKTRYLRQYPVLRHFVSEDHPFYEVLRSLSHITDFIKVAVNEHQATLDPDNPRDFIDVYLREMEKQRNDPNTTFTETQLLATCTDILLAGTETGSSTVSFGILLMTLHPEVMAKVQKELDEVVGRDRFPSLEDRNQLVYTDATLSEIFRFRCVAPFTIQHKAKRDTILHGSRIPADTFVWVNLYSVQQDSDYWGDPEVFRPERFINTDGTYRKDERHIPFGKGRRKCLGESLARMASFILFSSLVQHFTFSLDPAVPVTNTEGKFGFSLGPPEFRVFAKTRV